MNRRHGARLLSLALLAALASLAAPVVTACSGGTDSAGRARGPSTAPAAETATVRVRTLPPLRVEVARTPEERAQGLSGREHLARGTGMMFVYDSPTTASFWMHDVHFPLSLVWVRDGRVIGSVEMAPCTSAPSGCRTYEPPGPFDMAIEAPADTFTDVQPGTRVRVSVPGPSRSGTSGHGYSGGEPTAEVTHGRAAG